MNKMQTDKKTISPLLYFILVSTILNLIFVSTGTLILIVTNIIDTAGVLIIAFIFLLKGPLAGLYTKLFAKGWKKELILKFLGIYHSRIISFFAGVAIGFHIAKGPGAIVGAILFYFLGRWIGPKLSVKIAYQLEKIFQVELEEFEAYQPSQKKRLLSAVFYLLFPTIFIIIAFAFEYFNIRTVIAPDYLQYARLVFIFLTVFFIGSPWFIKNRVKFGTNTTVATSGNKPVINLFQVGLSMLILPGFFGFILFLMGGSIIELSCFVGVSMILIIIWTWNIIGNEKELTHL